MFAGGQRDIACCAAYRRSVHRRGSAAGGVGVFSRLAGNGSGFSIHPAGEHRGEQAREHRIPGYRGDRELFDEFFHSVACGMCHRSARYGTLLIHDKRHGKAARRVLHEAMYRERERAGWREGNNVCG
jgi:hypothetical protein